MRRPEADPPPARVGCSALIASGLLAAASAGASPDGADWAVAGTEAGCGACHLSDAEPLTTAALEIRNLPASFEPGKAYRLTIVLTDAALENAGFLLTLRSVGDAADGPGAAGDPGTLAALDQRVEVMAGQARSTWDGSFTAEAQRASWTLVWTAPETRRGGVRFDLWANAGNDDLSPLGDRLFHRVLMVGASETVQSR